MSAFPYLSGTANQVIPSAATSPDVTPSGSAWTYGSYVELLAAAAEDLLLTGLTVKGGESSALVHRYELELAVGAGGAEVPIATIPGVTSNGSEVKGLPSLSFPYPLQIASGARIAARIRRSDTISLPYKVALRVVPASYTGVLYDTSALVAVAPSGSEAVPVGSATAWVTGASVSVTTGLASDAVVFAVAMSPGGLGWTADWECDLLVDGVVAVTIRDASASWDEGGWRPVPPFLLPASSDLDVQLRTNAGAARAATVAVMYYVNPGADIPSDTLIGAATQVYPAAANALSVTAGASQAYGAWVEFIPSAAADLAVIDAVDTGLTAATHLQIGIGALGTEQPIATLSTSGLSSAHPREWMPFFVPPSGFIPAGSRVSVRSRNILSAVVHPVALVVLPVADLGLTIAAVPKIAPNEVSSGGASLVGSGAAWTNGAWVEVLSEMTEEGHVYGVSYSNISGRHEFEIDLRVGVTVAYTWRGVTGGSGRFVMPADVLIKVSAGEALSLRVRSDNGGGPYTAAILYYGEEVPPSLVGCAVFGRDTTVAATLAIAMGLDGDTHIDLTPNTLTVYGDEHVTGVLSVDDDIQINGDSVATIDYVDAQIAAMTAATRSVGITIDGGTSVITTGLKGFTIVPYAGTITKWTLLSTDTAVTSGSIVIDVWKRPIATSYPPTVADTITASAKPTLSTATNNSDATLTGWGKTVTAGDVFGFTVDSATSVKRVTLLLEIS